MDGLNQVTVLQTMTMQRKNQAITLCSKMQIESLQPVASYVKLAFKNAFLAAEDKIFCFFLILCGPHCYLAHRPYVSNISLKVSIPFT